MGTNETRPELNNPRGDIGLHRVMRMQALRAPWSEVAAAVVRLIEWRSFGLWVRTIADSERAIPNWLAAALQERCPNFLESRRDGGDLESLWIDLSEWIDNHFFGDAQRGGWIQALHYYSGRTAESENVWQHWTRLDAEWRSHRPSAYPGFEQWHLDAVGATKSADAHTSQAAQYVEWEAFTSWVGCVVECAREVPALVAADLDRRYPGFVAHARSQRVKPCSDPQWLSSELLTWIEGHAEVSEPLTDDVRAAARSHLRWERITEYAAECSLRWGRQLPPTFPSFELWLADADGFIVIDNPSNA